MNKAKTARSLLLLAALSSTLLLQGCASGESSDEKIHITMIQYKPEAVKAFEKIEERFNAAHDWTIVNKVDRKKSKKCFKLNGR